jgi:hypothetical protein
MRKLIVALLLLCAGSAYADTKISMDSLSADGLEMKKLACELDGGGFFGGIVVVGMVAKQKPAIDACAPAGASFAIDLDFRGGRTTARVASGGTPAQRACVQRALGRVAATLTGHCSAVLLAGAKTAAAKANDAEPAEGGPQRAAKLSFSSVRPEQLRALVGQPLHSKLAQALLGPYAGDRSLSPFSDCTYHNYNAHGLSLRVAGDTITTVFLYAQGADDFEAYPGALPENLSWSDTRADVETKLGAPTKTGGDGVIAFWAEHGRGLSITYREKSPTSLRNSIHHIVLHQRNQ